MALMGDTFTINSTHSRVAFDKYVDQMVEEHKHITFAAPRIGADRSLTANALSHVWFGYADKMLTDQVGDNRRYCKLHFGVMIMRAEDEKFRALYDKAIKPFDYETKLQIMDYWPVTSLMSREQMCRFLTSVQMHYAEHRGLVLEGRGEFKKFQEGS